MEIRITLEKTKKSDIMFEMEANVPLSEEEKIKRNDALNKFFEYGSPNKFLFKNNTKNCETIVSIKKIENSLIITIDDKYLPLSVK